MIINTASGVPKKYIDQQDSALQSQITAEISNRTSADNTLQTKITTEATTRANADTALDAKITTINNTLGGLGTAATKDVGTASGQVPIIGSDGKLATGIIPQVALSELVGTVSSVAALSGLTAQNGDWAVVEGSTAAEDGAYIYSGGSWVKIGNPDLQFAAIGGAPTDNTALKSALDAKLNVSAYFGPTSAGTATQAFTGAGWVEMPSDANVLDNMAADTATKTPISVAGARALSNLVSSRSAYMVIDLTADSANNYITLEATTDVDPPTGYSYVYTSALYPAYGLFQYYSIIPMVIYVEPTEDYAVAWTDAEAKAFEVSAGTGNVLSRVYVASKTALTDMTIKMVAWRVGWASSMGLDSSGSIVIP